MGDSSCQWRLPQHEAFLQLQNVRIHGNQLISKRDINISFLIIFQLRLPYGPKRGLEALIYCMVEKLTIVCTQQNRKMIMRENQKYAHMCAHHVINWTSKLLSIGLVHLSRLNNTIIYSTGYTHLCTDLHGYPFYLL